MDNRVMEKMIELHNVSYRYPNAASNSLNQVDLAVERGMLVAIMGLSGAGKTTLALCLNGLIPQLLGGDLTGDLAVAGRDLRKYRVQTLTRHIGLVLQDPETQIFGLTVAEDIAFGLRNLLIPAGMIEQRVAKSLQRVGLQGYQNRNTAELSGGEKQRLAIAGILALQPEVLVLDEPSAELDPAGRTELYQTLDDLRRAGDLTVLTVEHSGEAMINRADAVVIIDQGRIIWQGAPRQLFRNIPLLAQFGIEPLPVSRIGWAFFQKGWIEESEIPLDVPAAESLIRKLLAEHGIGRFIRLPEASTAAPTTGKNAPAVLEFSDLTYEYPNSTVNGLRDINLTVRQGEFVALIGANGAGKTTLAKHCIGLLKPSEGAVHINGMNTREYNTACFARQVGFVFQNPDHQIFTVSVEQELEYGLKNSELPETEIRARVEQILQWLKLESFRKNNPFTLGKGQRQLVALAAILVLKPPILVIDEPTTGLDWAETQNIMGFIKELHQVGTTIIMITHDLNLVGRYAHRVLVMKEGRILQDGPPEAVLTDLTVLRQAGAIPPQMAWLTHRLRDIGLSKALLDPEDLIQAVLQASEGNSCS